MTTNNNPCTCHPDEKPSIPCAGKYALSDCKEADFLANLVQNAFSWALQQCNYLDPKYAERLVAETKAGMKPEQAATWRADGPEVAAGKAKASIRQVGAKMMRLNEYDQRKVIEVLGLEETGDDGILDWQAALAAVKRAAEIGTLEHLEKAIDAKLEALDG